MNVNSRGYFEDLITQYCKEMTTHIDNKQEKAKWFNENFGINWSELNTVSLEELDVILIKARKLFNELNELKEPEQPLKKKPTCTRECSFSLDDPNLYK